MAANRFSVISGKIATGTSAKTILQLLAAANHGALVKRISVSFDGISPTDAPVLVEVLKQSSAGTDGQSVTPKKLDDDNDDAIQATALEGPAGTWTAEPTAGDILLRRQVHPQTGFSWIFPFGEWQRVAGGDRLAVRVTAGVDIDCVAEFICEE